MLFRSTRSNPVIAGGAWFLSASAGRMFGALTLLLTVTNGLGLLRLVALAVATTAHARRRRRWATAPASSAPVSVVVPAYNEQDGIVATLTSLTAATSDQCEIIVVDDGSTDNTAQWVAEAAFPRVQLIRQPNSGKSATLNTGFTAARHELIMLIDGDTVVHPDAVRELVSAADRSPDVAAERRDVRDRKSVV